MFVSQPSLGYSARVRLELRAGGKSFPLAQIGGRRLIFDDPITLPGTDGEVVAHIDEHQQRWAVTWTTSNAPRRTIPAEFTEILVDSPAAQ